MCRHVERSTSADEDLSLMLRVSQDDRDAFGELYAKYVPIVWLYLRSLPVKCNCPEDVVQEVFMRVWERRGRYCPRAQVKTYLFAITRNVLLEHGRVVQRQERCIKKDGVAAHVETSQPCVHLHRKELADILERIISTLPPKQREAIELIAYEHLPICKAARRVGCSTTALRNRLYQARVHVGCALARLLG